MKQVQVRFAMDYISEIQTGGRITKLNYKEGDEVALDPEVAAFISKDCKDAFKGSETILETSNRMIVEGEARAVTGELTVEVDVDALAIPELKDMLAGMGLKVGGNRKALIKRLKDGLK